MSINYLNDTRRLVNKLIRLCNKNAVLLSLVSHKVSTKIMPIDLVKLDLLMKSIINLLP